MIALDRGDEDAGKMCDIFQKRRDLFFKLLTGLPKLKPFRAQGAFYMFVDIRETGMDSLSFSKTLLEEAHVAVVPGKPFGADQYVRMSFASSEKNLQEAIRPE